MNPTVPTIVIVPAVLMVRLFCNLEFASPPDQFPVPLRTMFVVPVTLQFTPPNVRLPPTKIVNPLMVVVALADPMVNVPVTVWSAVRVTGLVPVKAKLPQVIPLGNVVVAKMVIVDPAVTMVPAVYVNVPVSYLTIPERVIVPAVLIVRLFRTVPLFDPVDHVPVPLSTIFVVPTITPPPFPPIVMLPETKMVKPLRVVVLTPAPCPAEKVPVTVTSPESVYVAAEFNVKLFHTMPTGNVRPVEKTIVDPVVVTVPAV